MRRRIVIKNIKTKKYSQEENVNENMISVMEIIKNKLMEEGIDEEKSWNIATNIVDVFTGYDVLDIIGMPYIKPRTKAFENWCY